MKCHFTALGAFQVACMLNYIFPLFSSGHTVMEATANTTNAQEIMWDLWSLKKRQNETQVKEQSVSVLSEISDNLMLTAEFFHLLDKYFIVCAVC